MARQRKFGEDLAFAQWHRNKLTSLYKRIGHRLDLCDRDWTEFCHFCKEPLALIEEVVDRGQDLNEKSVRVTRRLAERSRTEAYLLAPRIERPTEVQNEIDALQERVLELQTKYPIAYFTIKELWPSHGQLKRLEEMDCARFILSIHRAHHSRCRGAEFSGEHRVDHAALIAFRKRIGLILPPVQGRFLLDEPT